MMKKIMIEFVLVNGKVIGCGLPRSEESLRENIAAITKGKSLEKALFDLVQNGYHVRPGGSKYELWLYLPI